MLKETWEEQYKRIQRSLELLQQICERNAPAAEVIWPRDVVYHFCSDAFHLRDWIAATLGTDKASTEALVRQLNDEVIRPSPELSACSDIANGFKHLVLYRRSYVTGTDQGHAEVVNPEVVMGGFAFHTETKLHGVLPGEPQPEPNAAQVPVSGEPWVQYSFKIDINGQQYDAREVATKAVAAWDRWLHGSSSIAAQLR